MSTRATIIYLPDRHIHLFNEVLDDHVYLECQVREVEMGGARFESPSFGPTVEVTLRFDNDDFDALVDAYVTEREKRRAAQEEIRRKQEACPAHDFVPGWLPSLSPRCRLCGFIEPAEKERRQTKSENKP